MAEIQPAGPLGDSYQLYIDGKWVEPEDGRYDDVSPVTEQTFATAPNASVAQVGDAIGAARRAFDSGPWGQMSNEDRAGCLNQLGDALMKHADEFFALAQVEWGCIANVRLMQIDGAGFMSMHAASLAAQLGDQPVTGIGAGTTLLRHEPVGVVSILTPWNFPHTLNVMKLNNALAAGNTVVLKPSPLTPLTGLALARVIDEHTDIPPGVVNVVTPSGIEAAKLLTTDPRIDMISFTGSTAIGREVMSAAGDTLKRILLELGGKSASIILDDTVVTDEMLQQMLFESCSLHSGQACILHSRLLFPDALHDDVVDRLVALARDVKVGNPADPDVQMGPLISAAQRDRVQAHVDRRDQRRCETGGRRRPSGRFGGRLLLRADDSHRGGAGFGHRARRGLRSGAHRAALSRRRRCGGDREQLQVRAFGCRLGRRRGSRGRRCPPHPDRPGRSQRRRSRRCAIRWLQVERVRSRRRWIRRPAPVHGAEGHWGTHVMSA